MSRNKQAGRKTRRWLRRGDIGAPLKWEDQENIQVSVGMPEKKLKTIRGKVDRLRGRRVGASLSDEIARLALIGQTMPDVQRLVEERKAVDEAFKAAIHQKHKAEMALRAAMAILRSEGIRASKKDLARRAEDVMEQDRLLAADPEPVVADHEPGTQEAQPVA